jgi:hypothetical protein
VNELSDLSVWSILRQSLKNDGNQGKELMLLGVALLIISNFLNTSSLSSFNAPNIILWLGLSTFFYGLAKYGNKQKVVSAIRKNKKRNRKANFTRKRNN